MALGGDLFEDNSYFRARHQPPSRVTHEDWGVFIDELSDIRLISNVTRGLLERGYGETTVRKILGGNALRLYNTVLKS